MKKNLIFPLIVTAMFLVPAALILLLPYRIIRQNGSPKVWTDRTRLEFATLLLAKGLNDEAAEAFEEYVKYADADKKNLAAAYYGLGNIYMELGDYKKALSSFYRVEMIDKQADFRDEMDRKIVEALENLGMSSQARHELEARTGIGEKKRDEGKVVARIGKDDITESEIARALDGLPAWIRKNSLSDEEKREFIREYVAREVLYRKAKRLGLDRTGKVRDTLNSLKKRLAVEQLVQKEFEENVKITPDDLKLYYEANKDKFMEETDKGGKKIKKRLTFEDVKDRVASEYRLVKQREITGALLEKALEDQEVKIFFEPAAGKPADKG